MNTIWESTSSISLVSPSQMGLTQNAHTGSFESKNILQHLPTQQACIDKLEQVSQRFRELRIFHLVENIDIGLSVWYGYFHALQDKTSTLIVTQEEIQAAYSDTIHTAISYIEVLQLENAEALKQEIFDIITAP